MAAQYSAAMNPAASTPWKLGDFHVIGAQITQAGDALCESAGIVPGSRVLDIACGSGNTALSAARRNAVVDGIDIVEALIERAKVRAQAEGFDITFQTGDALALPYADQTFDAVVSTFGIMFAPDQERAADEALRVCKPGGTLAFASWVPESMPGAMFALAGKYSPPRQGAPPIAWGTLAGLERLFGGKVRDMRIYDRITYAHAADAAAMLDAFKQYFGPMVMLYQNAPQDRHAQIDEEFKAVYDRYNRSAGGTLRTAMHYVEAVMTKGTT